jgi:hypothetical protein
VTVLDVDVLLPMKVQDKLLPALDAMLDDKQVGLRRCRLGAVCSASLLSWVTEQNNKRPSVTKHCARVAAV